MNYSGIIFDLDGTLLDTLEDLADSVNSILSEINLPQHPLEDYRYHVGKGMRNLITNVLPQEMRTAELIDRCVDMMFTEYGKRWDAKTKIYDGIPELLDTLTSMNMRMSVVSNKEHHFTLRVVDRFLGRWRFDAVFGERQGVPRKPDPAGLMEAAAVMGVEPRRIICLGDSGSDMTAAVSAGMLPVGALWGFRDRDELLGHGAKMLISGPLQLAEIICGH